MHKSGGGMTDKRNIQELFHYTSFEGLKEGSIKCHDLKQLKN